jgi:hypothetical protein
MAAGMSNPVQDEGQMAYPQSAIARDFFVSRARPLTHCTVDLLVSLSGAEIAVTSGEAELLLAFLDYSSGELAAFRQTVTTTRVLQNPGPKGHRVRNLTTPRPVMNEHQGWVFEYIVQVRCCARGSRTYCAMTLPVGVTRKSPFVPAPVQSPELSFLRCDTYEYPAAMAS